MAVLPNPLPASEPDDDTPMTSGGSWLGRYPTQAASPYKRPMKAPKIPTPAQPFSSVLRGYGPISTPSAEIPQSTNAPDSTPLLPEDTDTSALFSPRQTPPPFRSPMIVGTALCSVLVLGCAVGAGLWLLSPHDPSITENTQTEESAFSIVSNQAMESFALLNKAVAEKVQPPSPSELARREVAKKTAHELAMAEMDIPTGSMDPFMPLINPAEMIGEQDGKGEKSPSGKDIDAPTAEQFVQFTGVIRTAAPGKKPNKKALPGVAILRVLDPIKNAWTTMVKRPGESFFVFDSPAKLVGVSQSHILISHHGKTIRIDINPYVDKVNTQPTPGGNAAMNQQMSPQMNTQLGGQQGMAGFPNTGSPMNGGFNGAGIPGGQSFNTSFGGSMPPQNNTNDSGGNANGP